MKIQNKALYGALNSSPGLVSPVVASIADVDLKINKISLDLSTNISLASQAPELVTKIEERITEARSYVGGFSAHVDKQLKEALHNTSVAKMAKKIDAIINEVPESCVNINNLLGSVMEVGEALISELTQALDTLANAINATHINLSAIENALAELLDKTLTLSAQITLETNLLEEILKTISALSDLFTLESLVQDPCAQAVLEKLLPNNIKQHLPEMSL